MTRAVDPNRTDLRTLLRWPAIGLLTLAFAAATFTSTDADLWGHLRFGLDTLDTWTLPEKDPYSFTQDKPLLNHEWMSELQMAIAWRLGGSAGLALLKGAMILASFLLVWRAQRGMRIGVRVATIAVLYFGTIHMTSSVRPQLWTLLFLAILARVLVEDAHRARPWLPVLFALWANNHGGWVVGLGVLGIWAAAEVVFNRQPLGSWALTVGASTIATLATPYGWKLWQFVLETVRVERDIAEWLPLWTTHWINWLPWIVSGGVAGWILRRPIPHRAAIAGVLALLAYMSLRVSRIESLFVVTTAIMLAPSLRALAPASTRPLQRATPAAEWSVVAAVVAVTLGAAACLFSSTLRCLPTLNERRADREAMRWLQTAQSGRLVIYFDWGEFALWHLHPRIVVSMDGRRETIYSDRRLAEHHAIVDGAAVGFETLAAWQPEYVWLPATSRTTREWLIANGFRVEVDTPRSFVAVRHDVPRLGPPGPTVSTRPCFPD
jgi:hypothetical protein